MAPYMKDKRNRKSKYTIHKSTRIDEMMNRIIKQYAEENEVTQSEAMRELLLHGVNYYYFVKDDN